MLRKTWIIQEASNTHTYTKKKEMHQTPLQYVGQKRLIKLSTATLLFGEDIFDHDRYT